MEYLHYKRAFPKWTTPLQIGEAVEVEYKGETKEWIIAAIENLSVVGDVLLVLYFLIPPSEIRRGKGGELAHSPQGHFSRSLDWNDLTKNSKILSPGTIIVRTTGEEETLCRISDILAIEYISKNLTKTELKVHYSSVPLSIPSPEKVDGYKKEKQRKLFKRVK